MYFENVFVQLFNDNKTCTYVELMSMMFLFDLPVNTLRLVCDV